MLVEKSLAGCLCTVLQPETSIVGPAIIHNIIITLQTFLWLFSGMDPCWDSAETQVQFPSGMCLHLRCHSSGKGSSQKSLFRFCYGPDVFLNRNSLLQSLSVPSLSSTSKTPEEVVLCAALCLFIMWRLFADSGLGQPHLTGLNQFPGLFGLGSCPPAAPQPCFVMAEKQVLYIHVYIWEKERSARRPLTATNPEAETVLWKRSFSLCTFSPALHTVPVKFWVGGEAMIL